MGGRKAPAAVLIVAVLAGVGASSPRRCAADDPAARPGPPAWISQVSLNGFLASSYGYNFNRPRSGTNQFRVFDVADNTFQLDVFELVAQKPVAQPRDAGFRVDLTLGSSIPHVTASSGLFRDETGKAGDLDVQQAYASWIAPAGSGLRLDLGKFVTHCGYEVIQGYDGWNDQATRSQLFGFAIPFTHVGARASYAPSTHVALMAMVVNGWDVARDNNRSKSVGAQVTLTPAPPLSVYVNGLWGPEQSSNDGDSRTVLDVVVMFKAGSRFTLGANADWGADENAAAPVEDAIWSGVAGYVRFTVTPSFALMARGESFDDRDGVRTGIAQTLSELTITPEMRLTEHLLVRADARLDHSNHHVFEKDQGLSETQPTVLLDVSYSF
jgi:hypothetical protein